MQHYTTRGVCARQLNYEEDDGIIKPVDCVGGCDG
ncbi:MAG: TSCPD domain-containing protein, partial [Eggerthellaceae bacterium]|nr:TSCPD domain-containing protein [Eggerthellaceae bacterium]